jgi:hypothetical protein
VNATNDESGPKIVYWHRELPPLDAELIAEHTVEANSGRVAGTIAHRDELWDQCYRELMATAESRLVQEVTRLGGHFAHVHDEAMIPSTMTLPARHGCTVVSATCCTAAGSRRRPKSSLLPLMNAADIVGLLIAALGGAAVGLERQWSGHAEGPAARFAGIRTFTMLGAVAGFSGWLWTAGVTAPAAIRSPEPSPSLLRPT